MNRPSLHFAAALFCGALSASVAMAAEPPLRVGEPSAVAVAPGPPAVRLIEAATGSYVRIEADQKAVDVSITLVDAAGSIIRSANAKRPPDTEALEALVGVAGSYRLEIASVREGEGTTAVLLAEMRAPTDDERSRVAAETVLAEADRVFALGTAESQQQAIALYEQALPLFRARGDRKTEGVILDSLGWASDVSGDKRAALAWYEAALRARRETGDRDGELLTLQGIGLVHHYLGYYEKAVETNHAALALAREMKNRSREAGLLHNIGGLYWSIDEMQTALDYYGQSLAVQATLDEPLARASTLNNIGDVYRRLGEYDRALDYFNQALEVRRAKGNRRGEAHSLHTIGLVYLATDEYAKALENFTRSLEIRRETGDKRGQAYSLGGSASAQAKLGERDKAIALELQAVALWEQIGEVRAEGEALCNLGTLYVDAGRTAEAAPALGRALELSRHALDRTTEANTLVGLAKLDRNDGDLAASKARVEQALAIVESLRGRIASDALRASYLSTVSGIYEFYVDLLMEMDRAAEGRGWAAAALEASERARARSLLDALGAASVDLLSGARPELANAEAALRRRMAQLDRQRMAFAADPKQKPELQRAELDLEKTNAEHASILARIRAESPASAELVEPRTLALPEIQRLLDADTTLVEFSLGADRSYAWAIGRDSMQSWALPGRAALEALARPVYSLVTARNEARAGEDAAARRARIERADEEWSTRAAALSAAVFGPAGKSLDAKRIVVVADGALQYVPFGALPRPGDPEGAPLIVKSEVVSMPSASSMALLRSRRGGNRTTTTEVAVFADPVFRADDVRLAQLTSRPAPPASEFGSDAALIRSAADAGFTSLPRLRFSRQEADAIVALAGAERSRRAVDFTANREGVLQGGIAGARIVHFATHGIVNSREPELSGLVLSLVDEKGNPREGFLRLREIYSLDLQADLVVLSACQTALGREIRGEGLVGLTRGFMHAGAPRVISSLWRVDDRATAELMKRTYSAMLKDGLPPSAALRSAQSSMAREARWRAPYFWAAFSLHGDWK
ncbi:MAG: CHAT domain-containing protein [Thermoanaerobaculia bacterium]|nr:CHAT domain-containing protein [Thermoanaerobaculia bacterium]